MDPLSVEEQRLAEEEAAMNTRTWIKHKYEQERRQKELDNIVETNVISQPAHYTYGIEPAEFLESLGIAEDFYAGNIIKYVARYKQKNGKEDIQKARQYCKMLLDYLETQI